MRLSRGMTEMTTSAAVLLFCAFGSAAATAAPNLVTNGSFENGLTAFSIGGTAADGYLPVVIAYNQTGSYPIGAQGEPVPTDNATSLSPDAAGAGGVYFVSDEAKNLSLFQTVYLTPGSYDIGFDSYDTYNGSVQPHDATLTATIAGVQLANFALSSVSPGTWTSHGGTASISVAGNYLVSFVFNTPDTPANPNALNPNGIYNAKDVVIDRVYVVADPNGGGTPIPAAAVPEPAAWAMTIAGLGLVGAMMRRRSGRPRRSHASRTRMPADELMPA